MSQLRMIWSGQIKNREKARLTQIAQDLVRQHGLSGRVEISVSFVSSKIIRQLNRQYLGKDKITDVLSFPLEQPADADGVRRLGDVVINELESDKEPLLKHGVLHLLGIHH